MRSFLNGLKTIVRLIFTNVFQSFIFDRQFILFHLYLFLNSLIFETLSGCNSISPEFNATVTVY